MASRLTSHSQGAGSVSSKSLRPKDRFRSGVANSPKLSRWASPQACTVIPVTGVVDRSWAITAGAPRRNANGEARMRAARIGTSSGTRCRLVSSSSRSGDGRPAGSQTAWLERGTTLRSSRPASARAPAIPHVPHTTPSGCGPVSAMSCSATRSKAGGSSMDLARGLDTLLLAAAVAALAPLVVALLPGPRIPQVVVLLANVGLGFLFLLAGYELNPHLFRERAGRLAIAGWLITVALATALVGVLAAVGFVHAFVPVALGLTTTAFGTLLPIQHDNDMLGGRFG